MSSKLQIRAKILELIENLDINKLNKKEQEAVFLQLKNFEDKELLQQILLKELNCDDENKMEKLGYLITEIANIEGIKEPLWDYIKDKNISDKVKEMSCTLLRIFGEKIRYEELVNYLDNPMDLIDAETKKLLDVALINPEVQIDFLDFLFALPGNEKINLVKSLEEDYQGDRLVNILAPILDSSDDYEIKELVVKSLGNAKTYSALEPLMNVVEYSSDSVLKKLAEIGLKKLKLSGVQYSKDQVNIISELACEDSTSYRSYISMVDGMGNQGVILSRVSEDENVQMFSVVINDQDGIVDCFGFYLLSKGEFERILESYSRDSSTFKIPPSYAKYCLLTAEKKSRQKQEPLPYEYLAWKSLFFDIEEFNQDLEQKALDCITALKSANYSLLLDSNVFQQWFFDNKDNEHVDTFFKELLVCDFVVNEVLEQKISGVVSKVFDKNMMELYRQRLLNMLYLLDLQNEIALRDNVAFLAVQLKAVNNPLDFELFAWIIRKSVYELFLRERASFEENIMIETNIFAKASQKYESVFSEKKIETIIDELRACWAN
ncbi:MAG: hypothetical protein WCF95_06375 [bacterium]